MLVVGINLPRGFIFPINKCFLVVYDLCLSDCLRWLHLYTSKGENVNIAPAGRLTRDYGTDRAQTSCTEKKTVLCNNGGRESRIAGEQYAECHSSGFAQQSSGYLRSFPLI